MDVEYKRWRTNGKSCGENNIDIQSTND
jgi:hypothetical protein